MAQTIKLKRSSVSGNTPSTSDLELGEVAINTYDGKMFIKKNDGSDSIVEIGGTSGTVTDAFKTIAVSGQTSVVADSATDTLTLVAGTNMSITTNAGGDTITFASTGSSGSATFLGLSDTPANFSGAAGKYLKVNSSGNSIEFDSLTFSDLASTPTTIAGYGITDALQLGTSATTALAGNTSIPSALTDLSISDGSSGQVLQTDGSGNFSFVNQTGGNSFGTIAVSGQSNVVADQGSDTLTLVAGSNVTLTTNASGDSVTIASTGGSGTTAADTIFEEYQFTATSGQTTFTGSDDNSETLSYTANAIQVYLNGIFLDPSVDYTATNGTSIVLAETVDANDYLQVVAYKKKISDGQTTVDTFSGNGSTTAFTLSLNPGDENNTRVFIDGVYQSKSNYSVSGTTLTFATAPPNGTAVEVEIGNRVVTLDTTASIDLPDNVTMRFGTGNDLVIKHDGSNSFIQDTGTGALFVETNNLKVMNAAGNETLASFNENGAVQLYHDNAQKFITTSTGVTISGTTVTDLLKVNSEFFLGSSSMGKLTQSGSNWIFNTYASGAYGERFRITDTGVTTTGTSTADAFTFDNYTLDNNRISTNQSGGYNGDIMLDAAGDIILDADSGAWRFKDNGGSTLEISTGSGTSPTFYSPVSNADIVFKGNDGGSVITALTLDMSDGGAAFFSDDIRINDSKSIRFGDDQDFRITNDGSTTTLQNVTADQDILIKGNDGGSTITALTLDMSNAGKATFTGIVNSAIGFERGNLFITENEIDVSSGDLTLDVAGDIIFDANGGDFRFKDNGTQQFIIDLDDSAGDVMLRTNAVDKDMIFQGNDAGSNFTALTLDMSDAGTAIFNNEIQLSNNKGLLFYNQAGSGTLGIKADTSDRLTFRTGGNWNRFILDGSGNGTFTGGVNADTFNATSSITTGYGIVLTNADTNYLFYGNSGSDLFYMRDTTNSQMITTWSPNYFQVNKAFYVAGSSSFTGAASFAAGITVTGQTSTTTLASGNSTLTGLVQIGNSSGATLFFKRPSANYIFADQSGGYLAFGTNGRSTSLANSNFYLGTDQSTVFKGNVGIGITPAASLHVVGPAARPTDLASVDTASTAQFQADSTNAHSLYIAENASGALIQVNDGATNSTAAKPLALQPFGGNVGIGQGVTAPTYTLDVQGTARFTHNNSGALFQEYSNGMSLWLDGSNGDFSGGDYFGVHAYSTTSLDFSYAAVSQARVLSGGGFEVLNGGMLRAYRSGNSAYGAIFMDTGENLYIRNSWANKDIHFRREGQVGIGQTAQNNNFSLQVTGIQTNGTDARVARFIGYGTATSIGSTGPTLVLQNGNTTANNYTKLSFETASAGEAVSILCQNTDHSNFYGDLVFNTRGSGGYSEKMRVTSNGLVGIGRTPQFASLEIEGDKTTSNNLQLQLNGATNTNKQMILGFDTTQDKTFIINQIAGSAPVPLIIQAGNVGISPTSNFTPGVPLHIASTSQARLALDTTSGNTRRFDIMGDASGLAFRDQSAAQTRMTIDTSGNLLVGTGNTTWQSAAGLRYFAGNSLIVTRSSNEVMSLNRLSDNGDVLLVRKDGSAVGSLASLFGSYMAVRSKGGNLRLGADDTDYWSIDEYRLYPLNDAVDDIGLSNYRVRSVFVSNSIQNPNGQLYLMASTNIRNRGAIHTWSNAAGSSEYARFDSSGRLLVGTTSTADLAIATPNIVTDESFGVNDGSNKATFSVDRINFNKGNYYVLNENAYGVRLINGNTSWTTQSDERLKENITELPEVLNKVQDLRCVSYNLKDQSSENVKLGFIAQDWQKDFSEVVNIDESDDTLGINYTETIPVLLKAIQEQTQIINDLRARVAQLEKE